MNHEYEKLSQFNLYDYIDYTFALEHIDPPFRYGVWPSDSSAVVTREGFKKVEGACHRNIFYRMKQEEVTNPTTLYNEWVWELGKTIEQRHIDRTKIAGLYKGSNVKFWLPELEMSGEIDLIVRMPDNPKEMIFCELKTSYGYNAEKEFIGNSKHKPYPKLEHIMQLSCYLYAFRDNDDVKGGKILYFLRDNTKRRQFDIHLIPENGDYIIYVDGERCEYFTFNDIKKRFEEYHRLFKSNTLPDRDYSLIYSEDELEVAYKIGEVTEKAYKELKEKPKMERPGDWRCRFCNYKNKCYSDNPNIST